MTGVRTKHGWFRATVISRKENPRFVKKGVLTFYRCHTPYLTEEKQYVTALEKALLFPFQVVQIPFLGLQY